MLQENALIKYLECLVAHILVEYGLVKKQHNENPEKTSNSKEFFSPKKNTTSASLE